MSRAVGALLFALVVLAGWVAWSELARRSAEAEIEVLEEEARTAGDAARADRAAREAAENAHREAVSELRDSLTSWELRRVALEDAVAQARSESLELANDLRATLNERQAAQLDSLLANHAVEVSSLEELAGQEREAKEEFRRLWSSAESLLEMEKGVSAGFEEEALRWQAVARAEEALRQNVEREVLVWKGVAALEAGLLLKTLLGL